MSQSSIVDIHAKVDQATSLMAPLYRSNTIKGFVRMVDFTIYMSQFIYILAPNTLRIYDQCL